MLEQKFRAGLAEDGCQVAVIVCPQNGFRGFVLPWRNMFFDAVVIQKLMITGYKNPLRRAAAEQIRGLFDKNGLFLKHLGKISNDWG